MTDSWLSEATFVLSCKVGKVPFMYLGLPIGDNPQNLVFFEPVINRIKTRLSSWQNWFLSFGGRFSLLKFVLTALSVYALSFFKVSSSIISSIKSLLNNFFFWGGVEEHMKIS